MGVSKFFSSLWKYLDFLKCEIFFLLHGVVALAENFLHRNSNIFDPIPKTGEIAVITGGARGLGAVVVKKLLQCDMHVIIGCRNIDAGKNLINNIRESGINTGTTSVLHLDMASLKTIKHFAENVKKETNLLHILINNAGIMDRPYRETEDGFESHWGVNYIGHFYLTHLLLDLLVETGNSSSSNTRIINVTSSAHFSSYPINFKDPNLKENFIPTASYAQSKLAQLLFTKELDRKLKGKGVNVRTIAVHPGVVNTEIFDNSPLRSFFLSWMIDMFFKTPDQGATSILYAAISTELDNKGGLYISNCRDSPVSKLADNQKEQEKLFNYSLSSVKIEEFGQM